MLEKVKKLLAVLCVFALVCTALPAVPAKAAALPKFKKTYASVYENGTNKGKYTYQLQNLTKGQKVKWSVSGAGKSYVTLKKTSSKVTKTTLKNVLTINTGEKATAKNKKFTLTAKIYSATNKLLYTVKTSAKIKIKPTNVVVIAPEEAEDVLRVGERYQFNYELTPVNATSTNVWTVTGDDKLDYSSYMSSSGLFQPQQAGIYTIKLNANIGAKTIKSASTVVEVVNAIVAIDQTSADQVQVTYSGNVSDVLDADDFAITNAAGAKMVVKDLTFSNGGKTATITTHTNFKDGMFYTISDGTIADSFTASVGVPVELKVLTYRVTVDKASKIAYALYDQNGVDVAAAYPGTIDYDAEVTNGYITDDQKLYMTTVGKTATVTLKYTSSTVPGLVLMGTNVITCESAATSTNTNFTLTTSAAEPDYMAASYKDNVRAAIGSVYYAHFRALDADNSLLAYSAVTYESSDPDTLIITKDGKVTPIRSGAVKIIVTAEYAGEQYAYSYDVTVAEAAKLGSVTLSKDRVTMSNVYSSEYRQYIDVAAFDQYGEAFALTNEAAVVTSNTSATINAGLAVYDAASDRIILNASNAVPGTYTYTLTVTVGGEKAVASFTVVVAAVPSTGTTTYAIEIDKAAQDLALNADVSDSRYATVRLAQYRGGVFTNYTMFTSATVMQGNLFYGLDLTAGGTTTMQSIGASNRLSLKTLDITDNVCRKAETGTYTIALQYYSQEDKAYRTLTTTLTLTDTQDEPEIVIERVAASKSCATALELAQNCLSTAFGTITECSVTGEAQAGSKLAIKAGDQVNIKSVTVVGSYAIAGGKTITMTYTVSVGKTLTNI